MRVDKPILKCDRCGKETDDLTEMSRFCKLTHSHMSGQTSWDLCPMCWRDFQTFMSYEAVS